MAAVAPFQYETPQLALDAILDALSPVGTEELPLEQAGGRFIAQDVVADRPSPACDVSAMDGYALRMADLAHTELEVAGEALIGRESPELPQGKALRIFTGSMIPPGTETIVIREHVQEQDGKIILSEDARKTRPGMHIRRQGENTAKSSTVVKKGSSITPASISALAGFGKAKPVVCRKLRVSVLVTGDELLDVTDRPDPWQLRESNSYTLRAFLSRLPWVELIRCAVVRDNPHQTDAAVARAVSDSDVLLMSGGVSMGQRDFVPEAVKKAGCRVIVHRLPVKPGKPVLAAVGPGGQLVMGLPGNPVSVMVSAHRFALPAMKKLAGSSEPVQRTAAVDLQQGDEKLLKLWWYRPVRLTRGGTAELIRSKGSGDLVSVAESDGFVEVPPGEYSRGWLSYYPWL